MPTDRAPASMLRLLLALVGVGLFTTAGALAMLAGGASVPPAATEDGATRLVVLGDTGSGNAGQYRVKDALLAVCALRGCDAAVVNGDLIYDTGVSSVDDPQFQTKFEIPYADVPLTFYLTLGNHDNSDEIDDGMGTDAGKGDVQVAYHYKDGTSGKWHLPARYYSARVADVELFSLDTNTMMSYGLVRKGTDPLATAGGQDPALVAQAAWIDGALAASDAPWRITFGHHPLYSNGEHGNAGAYENQGFDVPAIGEPFPTTLGLGVKAFLETHVCGVADVYLAGHDHDLQWLAPQDSCGATELLVSGAGSKSRPLQDPERNPARFQQGETLGFWWLELRADAMTAALYDADAQLLHEETVPKPVPR